MDLSALPEEKSLIGNSDLASNATQSIAVHEGTQRQYSLEDDSKFYGSAMFGLLRSDWGIPT